MSKLLLLRLSLCLPLHINHDLRNSQLTNRKKKKLKTSPFDCGQVGDLLNRWENYSPKSCFCIAIVKSSGVGQPWNRDNPRSDKDIAPCPGQRPSSELTDSEQPTPATRCTHPITLFRVAAPSVSTAKRLVLRAHPGRVDSAIRASIEEWRQESEEQ